MIIMSSLRYPFCLRQRENSPSIVFCILLYQAKVIPTLYS